MDANNSVRIGDSPSGVEWVIYRRDRDSDFIFEGRVALARDRFATLWERHDAREVSVRGLSEGQAYTIADIFPDDSISMDFKSVVSGTRGDLKDVAEHCEWFAEFGDHDMDVASECMIDLTDAQLAFGVRSRVRSLQSIARKIRKAV